MRLRHPVLNSLSYVNLLVAGDCYSLDVVVPTTTSLQTRLGYSKKPPLGQAAQSHRLNNRH
jgi:hypothetical protein